LDEEDLTWISAAKAPAGAKKSGRKASVPTQIRAIIGQFPGLSEEKVSARLEKAEIETTERVLKKVYKETHEVIDALKENGWKKAKK
jgi:phosphoserine phosphatase